jgi:hypothetical protein
MDIDNKLNKCLKITDIINNVFRPNKTLKKTRIKLYSTLALPTLLYGSESWTIKARDAITITAEKNSRIHLDRTQINTEIAKELNINPVVDKIQDYEINWVQHVNRMPRNRLPRLIKKELHPKRQKEPRKTIEETSGRVRPERVNKWPNALIAT